MNRSTVISRGSPYAWGAVVTLIVALFWTAVDPPGRVPRELASVPLALTLLALALGSSRRGPDRRLLLLLAIPVVAVLTGVPGSPEPERLSVIRDALILSAPWLVCLASAFGATENDRHDALDDSIEAGATIALLGIGCLGLVQAWTGWSGVPQGGPPAALFVNRNIAGQALVALTPIGLIAALRARTRWWRWTAFAAATTGLAFLVATRSRGAWIGAGVGLFACGMVWFVSSRSRSAPPRLGLALASLALVAISILVPIRAGRSGPPTIATRLASFAQPMEGSGAIRVALWDNSAALVAARPWLGIGPGRFVVEYPRYQEARRPTPRFGPDMQPEHVHNDWLEYGVELGAPAGLTLLLTFLAGLAWCFVKTGPEEDDRTTLHRAARAATIAGTLTHSLVSFPLHSPASALIVWMVVGRAWAQASHGIEGQTGRTRRIATALLVATTLLTGALALRELDGQRDLKSAMNALRDKNCPTALDRSAAVREELPWNRRARGIAAMITFECDPSEAALVVLEEAFAAHPGQLKLGLAVGSRRLKAGDLEGSEAAFRSTLEIAPRLARGWLGLAMAQYERGDMDNARGSCRQAIENADDLPAARGFCEAVGLAD